MHWLSILGIGLAANLDNLGIGVSFGARSTRVPFFSNLIISVLSMVAAYMSTTLGSIFSHYIPSNLANWSGGALIMIIGLWTIKSDLKISPQVHENCVNEITSLLRSPNKADRDGNGILSWKESFTLGIALALNCVAGGFGAGVTGVSPLLASISIGVFSLITIDIGVRAGQQIARTWLGKWSNRLGGILLVCIGLYEILA
ncbi:putative sporulation protein YtaF [Paenibacillus sp. yr247]|uniref:manganese efflux pump n=1 Tax=Paenibacillus sp. yr247 TaxID=1761880 RepID=UPI00088E0FFB|nr:manganese efflux pump [Paenibacillus sp. yr247]SDN66857.1 putative sporulation protein YtaF [Paenibacillus sp. yr247]